MFPISFVLFTAFTGALGAPSMFLRPRLAPATITALATSDIDDLTSAIQFARAAYCPVDKLMARACAANPQFQATLAGGMGNAVQFFLVGYNPPTNSIIVSHEGTDPVKLMSDLTDLDVLNGTLNSTLLPGAPDGLEIHAGFRDEHALTADEIRTEIGHSLGGALAELDALEFNALVPGHARTSTEGVLFQSGPFGRRQRGHFSARRVSPPPTLSHSSIPRFLGLPHPQGEIHIVDDDSKQVVACPGNDDATDPQCQIKTVPNILEGNILNHLGPYNGIVIGSVFCN
ncbi:hypothetical protein C8F04DRAFT_1191524 [Mycena alexandri]|uniref:Peroxidase n=1 Tax=Mycena alexandri TaxID=1745969 RepID=A0AAD6SDC3_9AGAR|nr:hypothetical protein C8F04DRAFT_1191524 [Mycena alexandri]